MSVVVPCYNGEATLAATIGGVLGQTLQDFEIIIVDDGSKDGSLAEAHALAQRDPRIHVIGQPNAGVSAARNRGIQAARGEFVALLDADDLWVADYLAVHLARMRADAGLGVSFSDVHFMEADGTLSGERTRSKLDGFAPADLLATQPCTTCSAMVIRAAVFAEVGMFRVSLRSAEDQEWLFRVALGSWRIAGVDQLLVFYRRSAHGLSSDLGGMYEGFLAMLAAARESAPELVRRDGPKVTGRMLRHLARHALKLGLRRAVARRLLARALAIAPRMLLTEPRQTIELLLASTIPGANRVLSQVARRA